ncbi:hypothetical protein KAR91_70605 [Candidatus Pacearchaeota archaeon]|nr:hypothetical protein [Candidatus Pacearchaeota archaeon]
MEIKTINVPENGIVKIYTAKGLDEKEQKRADDIIGAINTPLEYLTKRHELEGVDKDQTHIKFSYEDSKIILLLNEFDHYSPVITGKMIRTEVLKNLKINTGEGWTCLELAGFFRLNRNLFQDKNKCMELVTKLQNFEADVTKRTETKVDTRANYDLVRRQEVKSNLPESFVIEIPVFKGLPKKMVTIEVDISPESFNCILISPDLADFIEGIVEETINKELEAIKKLCPELPIIEI